MTTVYNKVNMSNSTTMIQYKRFEDTKTIRITIDLGDTIVFDPYCPIFIQTYRH
jgi:hypothetical protein